MFSLLRRVLWGRPPDPPPPYTLEGVSAEEAGFIAVALRAQPEFDHRVLSMIRESPHAIIVHTGEQVAPLAGKGETLRVVQGDTGWSFELVGIWVMWGRRCRPRNLNPPRRERTGFFAMIVSFVAYLPRTGKHRFLNLEAGLSSWPALLF